MNKLILLIFTSISAVGILYLFVFLKYNDSNLRLVICDVGQGDAIYIRTPERADILVDGGPDSKVLGCLSRHMPFWDRHLDIVLMTHPDADHATGLIDVIKRYKVSNFYTESVPGRTEMYKLLEAVLAEKSLSAKYLHAGNTLEEKSGFKMITHWPSTNSIELADQNRANLLLNELSVIELIIYGNFEALLTGDAGFLVMETIAKEVGDIDVLKVPHHGSKTGMSEIFLSTVQPELALISAGEGNDYGHPAPYSLELLKKNSVKTFRTDKSGDIVIISDGKIWSIKDP